jgi:triphosphoribosyl-dephospho-CoA synthase
MQSVSTVKSVRPNAKPTLKAALLEREQRREGKLFCRQLARLALRSLYQELTLYPKPGLVSLIDNGSHDDMDASTFMRSLFSLRHYFLQIAAAGMNGAAFEELKQLGIAAETRMLPRPAHRAVGCGDSGQYPDPVGRRAGAA